MTVSIVCDRAYHGDKLFDASSVSLNRDDCLRPWILLKSELERRGHQVHTDDILNPDRADLRLYQEVDPMRLPNSKLGSFVVLLESPIVRPESWDRIFWARFEGVFGWRPEAEWPGYRPIQIPYSIPQAPREDVRFDQRSLLCLVAGNKESHCLGELYSARVQIIRWYERHAPADFGLFGAGWDRGEPRLSGLARKVADRLGARWTRPYPLSQGPVTSKLAILSRYRFCLAFENVEGYPGYITEKIFDPMVAGCVPVYRGATNILDFVPQDCFIDGSRFLRPDELHEHLSAISESQWNKYRLAITEFLNSSAFHAFSPSKFASEVSKAFPLGNHG